MSPRDSSSILTLLELFKGHVKLKYIDFGCFALSMFNAHVMLPYEGLVLLPLKMLSVQHMHNIVSIKATLLENVDVE